MNIRNIALIGLFVGMLAECASPIQPDVAYPLRRSQGLDARLLLYLEPCGGASAHKDIDVSMEESQKALTLGIISLHLDTSLILQEVLRNASFSPTTFLPLSMLADLISLSARMKSVGQMFHEVLR